MKNKIVSICFILFIFTCGIFGLIQKDNIISMFERRKLKTFSTVVESKDADSFSKNMDDYLLDQFGLRNFYININSFLNRYILLNKEYNDVYIINDNILVDKNYPLSNKKVKNFIDKNNYIISNYLKDSKVYYSIIPDKAYFINDREYLKLDYQEMYKKINKDMKGTYIDITNMLSLDDYYKTDIHWKQENLVDVANELLLKMDSKEVDINNYKINQIDDFYGSSYSKAGINLKADAIKYYFNENNLNLNVKHLEFGKKDIYDLSKIDSPDKYDIFLSGASSFIEINNLDIDEKKELIIFRDSYASSIVPLLVDSYSKITLIDLRYIDFDIVKKFVDFKDKDVLFLYSTLIANNGGILKVNY